MESTSESSPRVLAKQSRSRRAPTPRGLDRRSAIGGRLYTAAWPRLRNGSATGDTLSTLRVSNSFQLIIRLPCGRIPPVAKQSAPSNVQAECTVERRVGEVGR